MAPGNGLSLLNRFADIQADYSMSGANILLGGWQRPWAMSWRDLVRKEKIKGADLERSLQVIGVYRAAICNQFSRLL